MPRIEDYGLEPLLHETEAAKMMGMSPRSLRTERTKGNIQHRLVAGKIYYTPSDLKEFQENVKTCRAPAKVSASYKKRVDISLDTEMTMDPCASADLLRKTTMMLREKKRLSSSQEVPNLA